MSVDGFVNERSGSLASKKHWYNGTELEMSLKTPDSRFKIWPRVILNTEKPLWEKHESSKARQRSLTEIQVDYSAISRPKVCKTFGRTTWNNGHEVGMRASFPGRICWASQLRRIRRNHRTAFRVWSTHCSRYGIHSGEYWLCLVQSPAHTTWCHQHRRSTAPVHLHRCKNLACHKRNFKDKWQEFRWCEK